MTEGKACLSSGKGVLKYLQDGTDEVRLLQMLGDDRQMMQLFRRALGLFLSGNATVNDRRFLHELPTTPSQKVGVLSGAHIV